MVRVGLFIPCFIDQLYPRVGLATIEVLQKLGVDVEYPRPQTCCGQPLANAGNHQDVTPLAHRFVDLFEQYDHVVAPSASCVAFVRHHFAAHVGDRSGFERLRDATYELTEYLADVLDPSDVRGSFPARVGLHHGCHGLRGLDLALPSERIGTTFDKVRQMLSRLDELEIVGISRPDECCGFGGVFAVTEDAISCSMGRDRLGDHVRAGAEVVTSTDMSCLMHLEGLARTDGLDLRFRHVAELLAEGLP